MPARGKPALGAAEGEKTRIVPMPRHMVAALRAHTAGQGRGELVFRSERGDKVIRGNVLKRRVNWRKLVARHGFAGFRVHDLRATAATDYLAAGVPGERRPGHSRARGHQGDQPLCPVARRRAHTSRRGHGKVRGTLTCGGEIGGEPLSARDSERAPHLA